MPSVGETIKETAFGALSLLKDNLPEHCKLKFDDEYEVVISALKRHGAHLFTHTVNQSKLEAFKLLSWIGSAIIARLENGESYHQHETVLDALMGSMEEILALETNNNVILTDDDRVLLKRFLLQEIMGNPDHGIGFNGLFVAFHCFRSTYRQLQAAHSV